MVSQEMYQVMQTTTSTPTPTTTTNTTITITEFGSLSLAQPLRGKKKVIITGNIL
jgi:hypothetical protein